MSVQEKRDPRETYIEGDRGERNQAEPEGPVRNGAAPARALVLLSQKGESEGRGVLRGRLRYRCEIHFGVESLDES